MAEYADALAMTTELLLSAFGRESGDCYSTASLVVKHARSSSL